MVGSSGSPRHRHDGTSPLPLGMDYSPAPARWMGPHTPWPHDPRTGWSYCIMIPSWTMLPDAKANDGHLASPIVFYRVQVGIQSPEGVSSLRKILRRFSDFLKLHAAVKKAFPGKHLPIAPPKNSMLWMNAKDTHLEERRLALLDWLAKLLGDIDVSRSAPVATFLELEAAARTAMQVMKEARLSTPPTEPGLNSELSSAERSSSVASEIMSETSDTPRVSSLVVSDLESETLGREQQTERLKEVSHDAHDPHPPVGRNQGNTILQASSRDAGLTVGQDSHGPNDDNADNLQPVHLSKEVANAWHARRPSLESVGSEISGRGSEFSLAATGDGHSENFSWDNMNSSVSENLSSLCTEVLKGVQATLPADQRGNVRRVLANLQRRMNMAKVDMEDLIIRLNQETAVKEFLAAKVRDLEGEVDSTRRKSKEMLHRAMSMEQETLNNLQWELEEARSALLNADEQARVQQEARLQAEEKQKIAETEKGKADQEVIELKEKLESLQKERDIAEAKSKAEMKVLAREIKALRKSQPELKEELEVALKDKAKLEALIQNNRQWQEQHRVDRAKFLHEVGTLRKRLQECSVEFLAKQEDKSISKSAALTDVMDLLMTSDNRIGMLAAEAQLLAEEKGEAKMPLQSFQRDDLPNGRSASSEPKTWNSHDEDPGSEAAVRKMLSEIFMDNIQLYKVVNSMTLNATVMDAKQDKAGPEDAPVKKSLSVLNRFL